MNIQSYLVIAIRFIALVILVFAARTLFWYFYQPGISTQGINNSLLFTGLVLVGFGLVCWFLPQSIAYHISKPVAKTPVKAIDATSLLRILVIFLGFYFFVSSLVSLVRLALQLYFFPAYLEFDSINQIKLAVIYIGFQIVVGIFLVFKNHWITQSLVKINATEKPKSDESDH